MPLLPILAQRRATGVFNFVNPGTLSYPQIVATLQALKLKQKEF